MQPGAAECRGTHVHAAAALAEVHGNADDANFLRHVLVVNGDSSFAARESAKRPPVWPSRVTSHVPAETNPKGIPGKSCEGRESPRECARCRKSTRQRSEEHTSELQSLTNLVCRLLLEKKKK